MKIPITWWLTHEHYYEAHPEHQEWHRWFAWRPVVIGNHIYWLQYVERKCRPWIYFIARGHRLGVRYPDKEYRV